MLLHTLIISLLVALPLSAAPAEKGPKYRSVTNDRHGFRILVPEGWQRRDTNLHYRQISVFTKGPATEIVITAMEPDRADIRQWEDWQSWYIRGIGSAMATIVESGTVPLTKNIVGRVILFEFTYRGQRVLQRVLIARYGDSLLVIECRAPIGIFGRYTAVFDAVMGSLSLTGMVKKEEKGDAAIEGTRRPPERSTDGKNDQ